MEVWVLFSLILLSLLITTVIFAWVGFFRSRTLEKRVNHLTQQVTQLTLHLEDNLLYTRQQANQEFTATGAADPKSPSATELEPVQQDKTNVSSTFQYAPNRNADEPANELDAWIDAPAVRLSISATGSMEPKVPSWSDQLTANIKDNWMAWLGGTCVGLSGIFLVKYSIDQGLLGPTARIAIAIALGLVLHLVAAYLRTKFKIQSEAIAALAGGASIILYAALLAALHLYQLLPASWVFMLLAVLSFLTMLTAFQYGPLLAAIGILGAYIVPILVDTGSNNVAGALIYSAIITLSALIMFRWIFRRWLWLGVIVASTAWWSIALLNDVSWSLLSGYLIVMLYAVLAIQQSDWGLKQDFPLPSADHIVAALKQRIKDLTPDERYRALVVGLTTLAWLMGFTLTDLPFSGKVGMLAYPALLLWLCLHRPVLTLAVMLAAIGYIGQVAFAHFAQLPLLTQPTLSDLLMGLGFIFTFGGYWNLRHTQYQGFWGLFTALAPVVSLALAYLTLAGIASDKQWALAALILALSYSAFAKRLRDLRLNDNTIAALLISAHFAYSLAVVIVLDEARLTLALALQTISLAYLSRQFTLPLLAPCVKALVVIVIARLTLNPYLPDYDLTPHWPLWVFGGPLLCCAIAWRLMRQQESPLSAWLQGACLHLLALTVIGETRYLLYNGVVFAHEFTQKEAAVNTLTWGALGLVYLYRGRVSIQIRWLYQLAASLLLTGALLNYLAGALVMFNPLAYLGSWLSTTPVFNPLLLIYAVPAVFFLLVSLLSPTRWRPVLRLASAAAGFIWINLEIRHLWQGSDMRLYKGAVQGELYTYSMVWLCLAIATLVSAIKLNRQSIYRAGMILLMGVVAKIFLVDMSGLTGLLRVTSFLGLGLCLLVIAFMHQKVGRRLNEE